jgi:hypothetical protein
VLDALVALGHPATEAALSHVLDGAKVASPVSLLRKRGLLRIAGRLSRPRAGARKVKAVRLLVNWDDAETQAQQRDAKAPGQARLLRTLASAGGGPLPLAEALALADATPHAAKRLEADGLVADLISKSVAVRSSSSPGPPCRPR